MEDGQIEMFTSEIFKMKGAVRAADKKKDAAKELKKEQDKVKKLEAKLVQARVPDLYDKHVKEGEIDAEQVEMFKPRKQRFGPDETQKGSDAFLRTLTSGREVGETWSERKKKITSNKRPREQPIEEADGEWHYAEEEDNADIDAQAADVESRQMDEEQDVYNHPA